MIQKNINNEMHIGSLEISADLNSGMYILEIIEDGKKHSIKVVIY